MWRAIPVLICVVYLAVGAIFVSIPIGCFYPEFAWSIDVRAFETIAVCIVLLAPITVPFAFGKMFK